MASETVYISGILSWVKAVVPDQQYECWMATIHPDSESLDKIRDLQTEGLKNAPKKDEDGYYYKFRCPVNKMIRGKVVAFTPPIVVDKDGKAMDGTKIGNGSSGTLMLEVYQHGTPGGGKAKAARLKGVKVNTLVEFNPEKDFTGEEREGALSLKDQPEPLW